MTSSLAISPKMTALIDSMHNPVFVIDGSGSLVWCNQPGEQIIGQSRAKLLGRQLTDILKKSMLHNILKTGRSESVQKIVIGDKTYVSNRTPILMGKKIVGAMAVLQDISELEHISTELTATRNLSNELTAIIESSFDGIYVTDGEARTIRLNKAYEKLTGLRREELLGRTMHDLVAEGFFNESVTLKVLASRRPESLIQQVRSGKTYMVTGTPVFDKSGEISLVVTNVRDVTELHSLQRRMKNMESLQTQYLAELARLKNQAQADDKHIIISKKMMDVHALALRLGKVDSTVLIQGESGVGKEVVADIIHAASPRKEKPMMKISCAAIPEQLLESELFGYAEGAFTGAKRSGRPGLFEMADKGTLLLDEIGEMPLGLQAKLLRVVQDKQCVRIGSSKPVCVDVRILAATNRDLTQMVARKEFRKDLFFRLNVVPVHIPPLRERKEAIPGFVQHFLKQLNEKYGYDKYFSPRAMDCLCDNDWPGNVRELKNLIERVVVVTHDREISLESLPARMTQARIAPRPSQYTHTTLKAAMDEFERTIIAQVLAEQGSTRKAAQVLGVNQSTICRKAARHGIPCR
nr:sigma 54-interacting transcriptional regulator [uncultured Desulfobacter sp.]